MFIGGVRILISLLLWVVFFVLLVFVLFSSNIETVTKTIVIDLWTQCLSLTPL
jgi:hypothetical protein